MEVITKRKQRVDRLLNLSIELILIIIILFLNKNTINLSLGIIIWQMVHFSLISISDFYIDDCKTNNLGMNILYFIFFVFLLFTIVYDVFDSIYIRIQGVIVIFGNFFGNKIDKTLWKRLTIIYMMVIIFYEFKMNQFLPDFNRVIIYILMSIFLLSITERFSEYNRNIWSLHSLILFLWIFFDGFYKEEAFLFLIGGVFYSLNKILMNEFFTN
ncbi:hypothetical protein [Tenacibaculum halocynthiae]|uniref:hypothetical protein n=1 Tax=Tenacibaculum halocynthiae TaxID=1254437 RepID=UPI003D66157F